MSSLVFYATKNEPVGTKWHVTFVDGQTKFGAIEAITLGNEKIYRLTSEELSIYFDEDKVAYMVPV